MLIMMDKVSRAKRRENENVHVLFECHLTCRITVSYQEFLVMFRKQTNSLVSDLIKVKSVSHVDEDTLVGIDTKIPGGIYDSQALKLQ
jgi:hypothetical protein